MGFKIEEIVHPEVQVFAKQFVCSVCLCILDEPVQTTCDHIFCEECLSPCLSCPTCKTPLENGAWRPLRECNKPLQRMMHELKVWCPYHSESKFRRLDTLPFTPAAASAAFPAGGCRAAPAKGTAGGPEMDAGSAAEEVAEGDEEGREPAGPSAKRARAEEPPSTCDWEGSYTDLLATHLHQCQHHWIPCPRGCGERLQRKSLQAHGPACSKNFEACSICGEQVRCGDLAAHRAQKAELHVQLLEARCATLDGSASSKHVVEALENLTELATMRHVTQECSRIAEGLKSFVRTYYGAQINSLGEQIAALQADISKQALDRKVSWDAGVWADLLRRYPRDSSLESHDFWIANFGPFRLLLYPNGAGDDRPGTAGIFVRGPSQSLKLSASFKCGNWEATFHDQKLPPPPTGQGYRNSLAAVPCDARAEIEFEVLSISQCV